MEVFLLVTAGWVFSVCLHEFGHALVAYYGGDYTVKEKGYLTLNPVHYTHPMASLVFPVVFMLLGGIGLPGGAVYINDHLLRSRNWRAAVSLAGPAMNLVLVLLLCIPFWTGFIDERFGPALAFLLQLQISAVLFNLLPIPPLDGFQTIAPFLPDDISRRLYENSSVLLWIVFLLMWYVPAAQLAFWGTVSVALNWLGVDPYLALEGWREFQFWRR